jgi:hypothetical protein
VRPPKGETTVRASEEDNDMAATQPPPHPVHHRDQRPPWFRINWVAAGLRQAARDAGVYLPFSYSRRIAVQGVALESALGVTGFGDLIVIHTVPQDADELPVLVGFADTDHQWYRDGRRHIEPAGDGP